MPPRHAYWTIIFGNQPTAFRSATADELLPTLRRIQSKHPDAVMMWFARGRLWRSPEEAREALLRQRDRPRFQTGRPPGSDRPRFQTDRPPGSDRPRFQNGRRPHSDRPQDRDLKPGGSRPGDRRPPVGAAVYWTGGSSGYGHIAISVGDGKVRSTDAGGEGRVKTVGVDWATKAWGLRYAGWANSINGYTIPGVVGRA